MRAKTATRIITVAIEWLLSGYCLPLLKMPLRGLHRQEFAIPPPLSKRRRHFALTPLSISDASFSKAIRYAERDIVDG